jgi:hypothetical protein
MARKVSQWATKCPSFRGIGFLSFLAVTYAAWLLFVAPFFSLSAGSFCATVSALWFAVTDFTNWSVTSVKTRKSPAEILFNVVKISSLDIDLSICFFTSCHLGCNLYTKFNRLGGFTRYGESQGEPKTE